MTTVSREQYDEVLTKNKVLLEEVKQLSEENASLRKEMSGQQFDFIFSRNPVQNDQVGWFLCSTKERDNLLHHIHTLLEEKQQTKNFIVELLDEIFKLKNDLALCQANSIKITPSPPPSTVNSPVKSQNTPVKSQNVPKSKPVSKPQPAPVKSQFVPKSQPVSKPQPAPVTSQPVSNSQPVPVNYQYTTTSGKSQNTPVKSQNTPVKSQMSFLSSSEDSDDVLFVYEWTGDGEHVLLAGSFNEWKGYPMTREDQKWVTTVNLRPGRYEFKLIVDGHWQVDPLVPTLQTLEGITNNYVVVPPM